MVERNDEALLRGAALEEEPIAELEDQPPGKVLSGGALRVMWVGVFLNAEDIFVVYGLGGSSRIVLIACYAPLLLWAPLLAAVTISYARRSVAQSVHAGQRNDD
jgi:hypothetical protein